MIPALIRKLYVRMTNRKTRGTALSQSVRNVSSAAARAVANYPGQGKWEFSVAQHVQATTWNIPRIKRDKIIQSVYFKRSLIKFSLLRQILPAISQRLAIFSNMPSANFSRSQLCVFRPRESRKRESCLHAKIGGKYENTGNIGSRTADIQVVHD